MIIFYPPQPVATPIVVADMTDSSDRWTEVEIWAHSLLNMPDGVVSINVPAVYSCKYNYSIQHNGVPLGAALKMTMDAMIYSPPSGLTAQVSIDYVASAQSVDQMSDALVKFANPQFKVMTAVVVERTASSTMNRKFVAFSVILQPDALGTNATLIIRAASFDDTLVKAELGFQLDAYTPLKTQLTAIAAKLGYIAAFDSSVGEDAPVSGRLFQPATLTKILDEICLQNKLIPKIDEGVIWFYAQNAVPTAAAESTYKFSFLGYTGALLWGVGVENYANVRYKTPIFDPVLFDKITVYNDSQSALFQGFKKASPRVGPLIPDSYDAFIIRYTVDRNDVELVCEVTATNNWLLAQTRVDGILESKIFGGVL